MDSFTPDQALVPGYYPEGWSAKDALAHIGTWLAEAGVALEQLDGAAIDEGAISDDLGAWGGPMPQFRHGRGRRFLRLARRAAGENPGAGSLALEEQDHLGVDTAKIDPVLPAVLRTLRN
jgi:hypothetical protein